MGVLIQNGKRVYKYMPSMPHLKLIYCTYIIYSHFGLLGERSLICLCRSICATAIAMSGQSSGGSHGDEDELWILELMEYNRKVTCQHMYQTCLSCMCAHTIFIYIDVDLEFHM